MMRTVVVTADGELVARAKGGDRDAFDQLVGPLITQSFRLAYGMLHDREAAEDAVQESAIRAWLRLKNLRPGTSMRPWFLAIVANQCRTLARKRWWTVLKVGSPPETVASGFEEGYVRGADLRHALGALQVEQREVLVLHYFLDLPLEEVADTLGVPLGTVKSRIHRGLSSLRPHFAAMEALT